VTKRKLHSLIQSENAKEFVMTDRSIIVTDGDMERLRRLVRALKYSLFRDQRQLELLDQALESAEVRPPGRVPKDVVRMNSRVCVFEFDTRRKGLYTLVFPEEANISRGFISVLAPLGIALLGRRRRDLIEARVPGGIRRLRVEHIRRGPEITRKRGQPGGSGRRGLRSGQSTPSTTLAA
jgi:regulator of nucleoside diphosphate kinase